ncbi:response regulator [Nostoc sp. 106C]|uniref:ATP-binding response regulator n=1 Tax=Nostoc sp. 106C TaxID=1932667 RepID=UPI000A38E6E3|nr:response regulator [Nostoc sp. 106C]OUL21023.1 hybrid sensor histidine kinase/response regulator [Nostoc sp. RF31YmG]OUL23574.1 hybrid sensor histidine kinase/response regulator [Nostoc sp. 106C]
MSDNATNQSVILIVDDNPTNLELLLDFLEESGFKVLVAEDGISAVEMAEYASPDLILLDVLMPEIDGFETCRRLKSNSATQNIPVIFLTALVDKVDKVKGLNLGAVDYITKPLAHDEVLARIQIHMRLQNLTKKLTEQNECLEAEISERKQAEQKIREQAALLDITTDAIIVQDLNNQIRFWNQGSERLYGWNQEEVLTRNANKLLYQQETLFQLQDIQKSLMNCGLWEGDLHQTTKAGKEIIVASRWTVMPDFAGQPKSILIVNTDITEKKQLEAQFLRAQRMESIGTLASGIAHDLNNALTPMLMIVQLLEIKLADENSKQWLAILETNIKRAADLVKHVLCFSRGLEGKFSTLEINDVISEVEQIVKQTFSKSIAIHVDIPKQSLWNISGDANQLHQVVLNLCINARDAMPDGGILKISAKNVWIDSECARRNIDAQVGPYVMLTISDTGKGISKEIIDRIFEPFFTTKEVGQGTGLGLSTVMGIVKSHNGFVKVVSEVGKGTEFQIYLLATQTIETENILTGYDELPTGNGELILVVDDEESIREITKTALEKNAYKVLVAKDGIEAVALYTKHKVEISVVLIDMMMPSMDGPMAIRVLKKINPEVKIVVVSGLTSNHELIATLDNSITTFLPKPYTSQELLKSVQVTLYANSR